MFFAAWNERETSHGSPTFFANKKVYSSFVDNHHGDKHVAVWIPTLPGYQAALIDAEPGKFFRPPYVGVKGWVGIELGLVDDEELAAHLLQAWQIVTAKRTTRRGSS